MSSYREYIKQDLLALGRITSGLWSRGVPKLVISEAFRTDDLRELQPDVPSWMPVMDPLRRCVEGWEASLRTGKVTWGAVVVANQNLWNGGEFDHPAMVLWSPEGAFDARPAALQKLAEEIGEWNAAEVVPESLQELATLLRGTTERETSFVVPSELTGGRLLFLSSVLVVREHLPGEMLLRPLLPLCTGEEWDFPVVIPDTYWSRSMQVWWMREEDSMTLQHRISMMGPKGDSDDELPDRLRWYLTGNRQYLLKKLVSSLQTLIYGCGLLLVSHLDNAGALPQLLGQIGIGLVFMTPLLLGSFAWQVTRAWHKHQRTIDLYESLWREGGMPWTRFYLLPRENSRELHGLSLAMRILGNWVLLNPERDMRRIVVSVSEGSAQNEEIMGDVRIHRPFSMPATDRHRSEFVTSLRGLYRELSDQLENRPGMTRRRPY